jgi:hypothetical protein
MGRGEGVCNDAATALQQNVSKMPPSGRPGGSRIAAADKFDPTRRTAMALIPQASVDTGSFGLAEPRLTWPVDVPSTHEWFLEAEPPPDQRELLRGVGALVEKIAEVCQLLRSVIELSYEIEAASPRNRSSVAARRLSVVDDSRR